MAGTAGLPGPYLQENILPYQLLDEIGTAKLTVIIAIGSQNKREFFSSYPKRHLTEKCTVFLTEYAGFNRALLLDCELHL